jgi:thiosulfate reductase / polysulfide reductase chain A
MALEIKMNRRNFLKVAGLTGAAALGQVSLDQPIVRALAQGTETVREEKWVSSVCIQCPAGCGTKVRVVDGKAVKIEGNPDHPYSNGKLCPKGYAGLQLLYDADRVKSPLKRTNPIKGLDVDPKFIAVTWDDALNDIATRLNKLRNEGKSHTVAFLSGRNRGSAGTVWTTFTKLYGTPNNLGHSSICSDASKKARLCMDGNDEYAAYDWENCNYVFNFGGSTLEAWRPTNLMLQRWAYMRRGRPVRAKQVMVDTRFSTTAIKADEWLPVKPGTDGALALGIAHVILTEGLWDRSFVGDFKEKGRKFRTEESVSIVDFEETWTSGLVDWWNNVLINFTPDKASEITGIPSETIIRIAKEFATTKPAIACGERGAGAHTNGTYNHMAIHALNALVGSMFTFGGLMYQIGAPYASLPIKDDDYMDDIAKKVVNDFKTHTLERIDEAKSDEWPLASNVYQNIPDNHIKGKPYKLNMIFTYYTNPLFSNPNPQRAWEAFKDIFIVETSSYLSETALYADYILPDTYYLERWHDDRVYPSTGYPVAGLRVPAVKLYDTRNSMEVIIDIGKRMGGKIGEYYNSIGSFENMLHSFAKGFEKTPGDNGVNSFESWAEKGAWYKRPYLYRFANGKFYEWDGIGYNREMIQTEEVKEEMIDGKPVKTTVVKNPVKDGLLKTTSGKFEFRSSKLEMLTDKQKEILKSELKSPDLFAYPHFDEPHFAGKEEGYPLYMSSPKMITHAEGRGANAQWLQERFGIVLGKGWTSWVELNPDKAEELGIKNGDEIWVESSVGKVKTIAVINPGNPPWIVVFPFENGHWNYGRYAKGLGVNPNEIIANLSAVISAQSCTNATMVKVYKA